MTNSISAVDMYTILANTTYSAPRAKALERKYEEKSILQGDTERVKRVIHDYHISLGMRDSQVVIHDGSFEYVEVKKKGVSHPMRFYHNIRMLYLRELAYRLMRKTERDRGFRYDTVLYIREDNSWFSNFNMFLRLQPNEVLTSNSCHFGGLNDKVFLMGRDAAEAMMRDTFTIWREDGWNKTMPRRNTERTYAEVITLASLTMRQVYFPRQDLHILCDIPECCLCVPDVYYACARYNVKRSKHHMCSAISPTDPCKH
jgi:hypothetical protein